ncbi:MAG: hypothetical protein H0X02_02710 [Nitrosomonas sp.]|nr:hypothetical protein [Nitrosomonas sp.]
MNISSLARSLGLSRQMVYKLANQGMPTDSVESALAWRKTNIDPFRSKALRIDGNKGVKYKSPQVDKSVSIRERVYNEAEITIIEETLTRIVPGLWFGQIGWLGTALREQGVKVVAEQLIGAQSILFLLYMNEVDELFKTECTYETPSTLMTRYGDKTYPQLIAQLNQILSE